MVETRASSPKKGARGRPPLPTQAGKAKKAKTTKKGAKKGAKKAPATVAAAAKQSVAEVDGKVYVKPEPDVNPGGNYTADEDLYFLQSLGVCLHRPNCWRQSKRGDLLESGP